MEVSRFSDLKPCRDLIDPNFGGYKLSLDALPVYSLSLNSGMLTGFENIIFWKMSQFPVIFICIGYFRYFWYFQNVAWLWAYDTK